MVETVFMRVRRVVSASVEDVVDAMERAGGTSVMREAIREAERTLQDVREEHVGAETRRLHAIRQRAMLGAKLRSLTEKAEFALAHDREDLAEAALSRQLDFERRLADLDGVEAEAVEEAHGLATAIAELEARRDRMSEELATFEAAERDARAGAGSGPIRNDGPDVEARVSRAERAFARAMAGGGATGGFAPGAAREVAMVAEIEVLQRADAIRERMAALRAKRAAA